MEGARGSPVVGDGVRYSEGLGRGRWSAAGVAGAAGVALDGDAAVDRAADQGGGAADACREAFARDRARAAGVWDAADQQRAARALVADLAGGAGPAHAADGGARS